MPRLVQPVIDSPNGPQLPAEMMVTFVVTLAAVLLLVSLLVAVRYRIESVRDALAVDETEVEAAPGQQRFDRAVRAPAGGPR